MTKKINLSGGFKPPIEIVKEDYVLEVLGPKHNKMDFEAWSSSKKELRNIFGPRNNWPFNVTTLEDNLKDLEKHYNEFITKEAFTYTILNKEKTICIGCLYIRPTSAKDFDCKVDFWFRNSHKNLESKFFEELKKWLSDDWSFKKTAFPGRNISWSKYYSLID